MLTLGKIRGLDTLAARNGTFSMLALDHRGTFRRMTADLFGGDASWADVVGEKVRLADALIGQATAALLDPLYASGPLIARGVIPGDTGFIVAVERSGHEDGPSGRLNVIEPGWSVEAIKRMGADGVKLLVQYHPEAGTAAEQERLVETVASECRQHDIALVLEPVVYNPSGSKDDPAFRETMPDVVAETARRFDDRGADLLKLDFPAPAASDKEARVAASATVSAATRLPWVVLSAAVDFDAFLDQTRAACEGGASGFLGGRAIWKEAMTMTDPTARSAWLNRVAAPRFAALRAVTDAAATPWRDRPIAREAHDPAEDWHLAYAGR
jgi:tagatose 1,6-diphosphate aldolase